MCEKKGGRVRTSVQITRNGRYSQGEKVRGKERAKRKTNTENTEGRRATEDKK
jgi:hypothetical protein